MSETVRERSRRALMDACLLTLECHAIYLDTKNEEARTTYLSALSLMATALEYLTDEMCLAVVEETKRETL